MTRKVIAIIGPGEEATQENLEDAIRVGKLIAQNNLILLTGGRSTGVMNSASKGAKDADGLVVGILPTEKNTNTSDFVDIPIYTGVGSARNNFIVLSSQLIIAVGIGAGTSSEIALALKANKPVVLFKPEKFVSAYFSKINPAIRIIYDVNELNDFLKTL